MNTTTTEGNSDAGETTPATVTDADEDNRFRIQTIINFLDSQPKAGLNPAVQHAWDMAARAACEAVERIFRGDV